ncbi:Hypothetical Protein MfeM64YM_0027 [Mycoplasmopsis fermentans M64]|uniref:Uncharacterized protein n=1 Tax=Mycoplasmopsis fermentans (strain M64) TaxID=943945 RepID=A0AB32X9X7_MYCFM|nr:Hypothetical Protein MfeM64YM_0027 [Mycoplasmopsis fermentans M64]
MCFEWKYIFWFLNKLVLKNENFSHFTIFLILLIFRDLKILKIWK